MTKLERKKQEFERELTSNLLEKKFKVKKVDKHSVYVLLDFYNTIIKIWMSNGIEHMDIYDSILSLNFEKNVDKKELYSMLYQIKQKHETETIKKKIESLKQQL